MKKLGLRVAAAALVVTAGAAQAALVSRGGGMIYDSTRDITWLADMNYANTSGYSGAGVDPTGKMTWVAAGIWANGLVYGGYDDWRLPTLNSSDTTCDWSDNPGGGFPPEYYGPNCTGGEMSHLFASDLGNKAGESVLDQNGDTAEQIANLALFSNVQSAVYWSGTESASDQSIAWRYQPNLGVQFRAGKTTVGYTVAVRPGDVAPVPEPQTLALALLAMGAAVAARRKRPA